MKPLGINLIVNMYHQVDLYQVCSNYAPWIKNGSDPWVTCYKENIKKIFLSETTRQILDSWYILSPSDTLPNLFKKWPLVKNGAAPEVKYVI